MTELKEKYGDGDAYAGRRIIIMIRFLEKPSAYKRKIKNIYYKYVCEIAVAAVAAIQGEGSRNKNRSVGERAETRRVPGDVYHIYNIYLYTRIRLYYNKYVPGIKRVLSVPPTRPFFLTVYAHNIRSASICDDAVVSYVSYRADHGQP